TTLDALTACSGTTLFHLDGSAEAPSRDSDLAGTLSVKKLNLTRDLLLRLPDPLPEIQQDYDPTGLVDVSVRFARHAGKWQRTSVVIGIDASARSVFFPYRVEHLTGTIEHELDQARKLNLKRFNLVGQAGAQPIHVKGDASGFMPHVSINVDVWGDNV